MHGDQTYPKRTWTTTWQTTNQRQMEIEYLRTCLTFFISMAERLDKPI